MTGTYDSAWKDKLLSWDGTAMTYDPCQEHPVRGYLPQCSSGTYHRCRHYTLLHNLPEIRRASGGNEMFSLLLQRLYRKYGSHREIHR